MSKTSATHKSVLSRLLATENLCVIHDQNAETASFDMKDRVLRIPTLVGMSEELYDMIVGHEVGHALYTPFTAADAKSIKDNGFLESTLKICDGDKQYARLAHSYINVVEDVRIEKLIKNKFNGLRRDFTFGYKELNERDFFMIKGIDVNNMAFIDRINLVAKIGVYTNIKFSDEEMVYVDLVNNTVTFEDVVDVSQKIWNYVKDKKKSEQDKNKSPVYGYEVEVEGEGDPSGKTGQKSSDGRGRGSWSDRAIMPDECQTQQNFEKNMASLSAEKNRWHPPLTYTIPTMIEKNVILPYKDLMKMFEVCVSYQSHTVHGYTKIHAESKAFMASSNKVVTILAQEFMIKKASKEHHRTSIRRLGTLDTVRMVNYKFGDDIFNRMQVHHKGKSHGLIIHVDLSGSMSPVLLDTFKQVIQLVMFCDRVNIPFEVYGFTTRNIKFTDFDGGYSPDEDGKDKFPSWKNSSNPNTVNDSMEKFALINLFSSKMSKPEIDIAVRNLFAVGLHYTTGGSYFTIPSVMYLSSTPLNEAIIASIDIVPKFRRENKLDNVNVIILTDGETTGKYINNDSMFNCDGYNTRLNNKYTTTDNLIKMLKDMTGCKAISFFLCGKKITITSHMIMGEYGSGYVANGQTYNDKIKQYSKEGWTTPDPKIHLYDEKFIIRANTEIEDADLDDALAARKTNASIRNTFIKTMNKAIVSRVMLNRFIEVITKED